ncbi:MAG TPA: hypothetical protein VKU03_09285 [Roseiarcus sp.]|nr:hypothetical protein [Roseiarcus sp.]
MIRRAFDFSCKSAVALAAISFAVAVSAPAQAQTRYPHHRHHHYARVAPAPVGGGDIVVRTGRPVFYAVDPYQEFLAGPRYYVDTALDTDPGLVHPFGRFGQSVLPSRFDPPGQSAPLFTFW